MALDKPGFRINYNSIIVIQSLPNSEMQTGETLYNDIISRRCHLNGQASYFYNPISKLALFSIFNEICAKVLHDELRPILHFEMHGLKDGIALKNGERVSWKELQEHCRLINIKLKNQLMVTLATCWGSHIWQMIDISQPAPYWGYIGPKETIENGILLEDFSDFYDNLLTEKDLNKALAKLVTNGTRKKYIFLHCKGIFEHFIEQRVKGFPLDPAATFKRLATQTKQQLPGLNRAERRKQLKNSISKFDRQAFIAKMKKIFLMT